MVPWVNVIVFERADNSPMFVLFEHAAHPVIVPDTSCLISADYPGAAVVRICELPGADVVPVFAQGCGGNINAYPLRTTHENTDKPRRLDITTIMLDREWILVALSNDMFYQYKLWVDQDAPF